MPTRPASSADRASVVNMEGLVEYLVEAGPIVVGEAQRHQCLGYGAPGEAEELSEQQRLHTPKCTLLAEGRAVRR